MRYVPVLNAGMTLRKGYGPYDGGVAKDVFLKTADGTVLTG